MQNCSMQNCSMQNYPAAKNGSVTLGGRFASAGVSKVESLRGLTLQRLFCSGFDAELYDAEWQWPRRDVVSKGAIRADLSRGVEHHPPSWEQRFAVVARHEPFAESAWGIGYDNRPLPIDPPYRGLQLCVRQFSVRAIAIGVVDDGNDYLIGVLWRVMLTY